MSARSDSDSESDDERVERNNIDSQILPTSSFTKSSQQLVTFSGNILFWLLFYNVKNTLMFVLFDKELSDNTDIPKLISVERQEIIIHLNSNDNGIVSSPSTVSQSHEVIIQKLIVIQEKNRSMKILN